MKDFSSKLKQALDKAETIVFGANCSVNYSGRAETYLPKGERIIMIKGDRTLLVHQPHGNNPINYMKENSVHNIIEKDGKIMLRSQNMPLKEFIDIEIDCVDFISSAKMADSQKIQLAGNEKDMSDMIYDDPSMIEKGFKPVSREEQTKYGFIDVLCHDNDNNLVVIECKRYKADFSAVEQLKRYVKKIKKNKGIETVRGILASPSITQNALALLEENGFKHITIEPPKRHDMFKKNQMSLGEF